MEDVLSVYERAYDKDYPVVCMDEKPFQLLDERYTPIPMSKSNRIEKYDCEYERKGIAVSVQTDLRLFARNTMKPALLARSQVVFTRNCNICSIFLFTEPLAGWRHAEALPQRTRIDWANKMKWLLDEQYPDVKKVVLVMDNLNTHGTHSFYDAFPPEEAFRLSQRLEIHYTPKHGSWLNIAENELSAMTIQCLGKRRIPTIATLNNELCAWHTKRNKDQKSVVWQFTTADARIKLLHLYPLVKN